MSSYAQGQIPDRSRRSARRAIFRILGVGFMLTAMVLIGTAVTDFLSSMEADPFVDGGAPTKTWMFFLAMPFFVAGGYFLNLGFSGAVASYMADEYTPALRTAAGSFGLGQIAPHQAGTGPYCRSCGRHNDADAGFCDSCGTPMST